jgi:imidazolonepropionase-like amidohydrolase
LVFCKLYTNTLRGFKKRPGLERLPPALVRDWTKTFDDYFAQQAKKQPDSLRQEQQSEKEYVAKKLEILKRLHQKGCKLLVSPDASTVFQVPGLSMIEEMNIYKQAGISEYDILKAATLNAAQYMAEANQWGAIQKGMRANLILLESNPLENIENLRKIKGVMKRGQWFSASKITELIETCKQNYREQP